MPVRGKTWKDTDEVADGGRDGESRTGAATATSTTSGRDRSDPTHNDPTRNDPTRNALPRNVPGRSTPEQKENPAGETAGLEKREEGFSYGVRSGNLVSGFRC